MAMMGHLPNLTLIEARPWCRKIILWYRRASLTAFMAFFQTKFGSNGRARISSVAVMSEDFQVAFDKLNRNAARDDHAAPPTGARGSARLPRALPC